MPTIIALDVSLSMTRTVPGNNSQTFHSLAVHGINTFLDYLQENSRLEQVSLIVYSSSYETVVDFTRDYDLIRQALGKVEHYDKTCLETVLHAINNRFQTTWGVQNYCQLIVVSDCGIGIGQNSVRAMIMARKHATITPVDPLPFQYPSNICFICVGDMNDSVFKQGTQLYQQLLDVSKQKGQLFTPAPEKSESEAALTKNSVEAMFQAMSVKNYQPFQAVLKCGAYSKLHSNIIIWPSPLPHVAKDIFGVETTRFISRQIEICGYLSLSDIGSPTYISRHLILPKAGGENDKVRNEFEKLESEIRNFYSKIDGGPLEDEASGGSSMSSSQIPNDSNKESVCVLLHGALKIENVAALTLLAENWFGFIYSYADSKKKSNLMLTVLPPGADVVPWLGDLRYLGTMEDALPGENLSFPVKPTEKRSYSANIVGGCWIRQAGLQSDIQKVLRHAKKLPEKTQHFYKELNRIKRAALSLGFVELLEGLAIILEREIPLLPPNASPDCSIQLKHSANELRKMIKQDFKALIVALPTKYNQIQ
ncbi:integrator complex subunit 14 [Culicoides brevitarsis]|uniref:integrator complex subunit 14 n=1 Tax=Culicoides brevitarsis TaxID=469753 RepID=UPI00307BE435